MTHKARVHSIQSTPPSPRPQLRQTTEGLNDRVRRNLYCSVTWSAQVTARRRPDPVSNGSAQPDTSAPKWCFVCWTDEDHRRRRPGRLTDRSSSNDVDFAVSSTTSAHRNKNAADPVGWWRSSDPRWRHSIIDDVIATSITSTHKIKQTYKTIISHNYIHLYTP